MVPNILNAIRVDAFKMARSGNFANAEEIEAELQRRGYERAPVALLVGDAVPPGRLDRLAPLVAMVALGRGEQSADSFARRLPGLLPALAGRVHPPEEEQVAVGGEPDSAERDEEGDRSDDGRSRGLAHECLLPFARLSRR